MIKKSIFTCLVLCFCYSIIIHYINLTWNTSQHQWQTNKIKAELYIYKKNSFDNVIIGSSLSSRLIMNEFPDNYYNLSFGGQSIYDGLEILKNSGKNPKRVFIETNTLFTPKNKQFLNSLSNPFLYFAKSQLPIFQSENQPLGVVGNYRYVSGFFNKILTYYKALIKKLAPHNHRNSNKITDKIDFMLEQHMKNYSTLPDKIKINEFITLLSEYISILEHRNIQVFFFEMPVHQDLTNLKRAVNIRKLINKYFEKNMFISQPSCKEYKTTDGLHLTRESAVKYTTYLKNKIIQL